ncbi:ion transporter [Roseiconus lacunae]|uniref:Ion transporter n=1 Tax=Roseiconus lacunae TaxID=2605694 RepID=A0ABT7PQ59_9BACT|nr:ion transporter [Roseiconus lacunae]MCD0462819.1 ion transporter [Roseiconus lacunae]MDM4018643.1 ion transporter [Roseiconus lacunae]WRQ51412.1 ion transporter [Stieleria sp. HD01]
MHDVIFESDTPAGWTFDVGLLIAILCSISVISLETIPSIAKQELFVLEAIEWLLTILFSIEYVARLVCARHPLRYAFSFWGIVDLLSILPTYIGFFFVPQNQTRSFAILRSIRLLRAFRVLKLWRMMSDADELWHAVWNARHKIIVFLIVVMVAVTISGTLMYFVETIVPALVAGVRPEQYDSRFDSIPQAMYWAIVTMTTVGYGDIVPTTTTGKVISATLILLGYSLIIVPSGFVTAELSSRSESEKRTGDSCPRCATDEHLVGAIYCHRCGERLGRSHQDSEDPLRKDS